MPHVTRSRFIGAVAAIMLLAPSLASAHSGRADTAAPQHAALLAAVVALGGGPDRFSAAEFRRALEASSPDEERKLRAAVGTATVDRFDDAFSYVVRDAVATMKRSGKTFSTPSSNDPRAVAVALFTAGLRDGAFDVEYLLDVLFSSAVHDHAMVAVARKYGADGETAYHIVLARLVQDLGKT